MPGRRRRFPQLILLDLYLPRREDGWQVLDAIRSMPPPIKTVPVVILSSSNEPQDISSAYLHQVTSYIIKPLQIKDWLDQFQTLNDYWNQSTLLPGVRYY